MRTALDTNILAYAEGVNDAPRRDAALGWLRATTDELVIPAQALGELFVVLTRKAGRDAATARAAILSWTDSCIIQPSTEAVMIEAAEIVTSHRLAFWDSVMLAAAAQSGCRHLLSEDMQAGFTWRGVTIRNPFSA
jgi:predicted nucleic acid-binding protein